MHMESGVLMDVNESAWMKLRARKLFRQDEEVQVASDAEYL